MKNISRDELNNLFKEQVYYYSYTDDITMERDFAKFMCSEIGFPQNFEELDEFYNNLNLLENWYYRAVLSKND